MRVFTVLLFAALFLSRASFADDDDCRCARSNTVLVVHAGYNSMTIRLNAELIALGYHPVPIHHPRSRFSVVEARSIINAHRAVALINTTLMPSRVDIWVVDPLDGQVSLAETVDSRQGDQNEASMFLKSVELLRAKLMKIGVVPKRDDDAEVKPTDDDTAAVTDADTASDADGDAPVETRRLSVELGLGVSYGFSHLPAAMQIGLGGHIRLVGRLGIDLFGLVPTFATQSDNEYGKARVWQSAVAAGFSIDTRPADRRVVPWVAALVGPHFTKMIGQATYPNTNGDDKVVVTVIYLRVGLSVALAKPLSLQAALHCGWTLPRPVVTIGEEDLPWGNPLFGGSLGLSFDLL